VSTESPSKLFFRPADTVSEAIERIYGLTGRPPGEGPGGTRAGKRALVALRDALGMDIDIVRTPAFMGAAMAQRLDIAWEPIRYTDRHMVNLNGYNALLDGATLAARRGSLRRLHGDIPDALSGPVWAKFAPARSKIEAVTRLAALTGSPREHLGPGSKEHKSVLLNLASSLFPGDPRIDETSKTRLGSSLAGVLAVPWTEDCYSTGETIQLKGLNVILAGAERHLGRLGIQITDLLNTPEAEGDALAAALLDGLPREWEGKESVRWLIKQGLRGAHDNEWQGFFGEEQAKIVLASAFTPKTHTPRIRYGHTTFDFALNWVWDIKVHTEVQIGAQGVATLGRNDALLNDESATRDCIAEQGLGFLILSGAARMDESGEFVEWHRGFKAERTGRKPAPSNSGKSRMRKSAFTPVRAEAFWVPNTEALIAAILAGRLRVRPIGRQAPRAAGEKGAPRNDKFEIRMREAREGIRVARYDFPSSSTLKKSGGPVRERASAKASAEGAEPGLRGHNGRDAPRLF
jgi:hypothetical protein